MRFWLPITLAIGIAACSSPPAPKPVTVSKSGIADVVDCFMAGLNDDDDTAIALCSRALQSGDLPPENIDNALNDRGAAYLRKGEYDRAFQDFDQAIRLKPDSATAYINRGDTYRLKGEYDRAIQDYDQAIRLDDAEAYINRGEVYQIQGSYERAIQDYDQAIQSRQVMFRASWEKGRALFNLARFREAVAAFKASVDDNPQFDRGVLWLAMARKRAGESAVDGLNAQAQTLDLGKWPGPVVRLYLGQISRDAVIAAAADPNPNKAKRQSCEAMFHIAEMDLASFQTEPAKAGFQHILDICPETSVWVQEAKVELGRL